MSIFLKEAWGSRLRGHLAFTTARLASWALRLLGRGATAFPGDLALKLDPQLLAKLCRGRRVILVTGTNGKTSSCRMIETILRENGYTVLNNSSGANLAGGLITALVQQRSKLQDQQVILLFEMDEAYFSKYAGEIDPEIVAVSNFFRDQLDRYGELDATRDLIRQGLQATRASLVSCADDPLAVSLADEAKRPCHFFAAAATEGQAVESLAQQRESSRCPHCGAELQYDYLIYGHLGAYTCSRCEFRRPELDLTFSEVKLEPDQSSCIWQYAGVSQAGTLSIPGYHNLYNAALALLVSRTLGLELQTAIPALAHCKPSFGRMERLRIGERTLCLILAKNPIGLNQALDYALSQEDLGGLYLLLNDGENDGRDISWIWDCDYEGILAKRGKPSELTLSGHRALDLALRLRYAGLLCNEEQVHSDVRSGLERALSVCPKGHTLYVIPNYTALLRLSTILKEQYQAGAFWENKA